MKEIIFILLIHFLADFAVQTQEQAENKYTDDRQLAFHVLTYTLVWFIALLTTDVHWQVAVFFCGITYGLHYLTDYITSRIVKQYFTKGDYHNGFMVIGMDQLLHYLQIILLFWLFNITL